MNEVLAILRASRRLIMLARGNDDLSPLLRIEQVHPRRWLLRHSNLRDHQQTRGATKPREAKRPFDAQDKRAAARLLWMQPTP
jgi:hypothetical protein